MADARLILDSGALSAYAIGDERMCAWVYVATRKDVLIGVPAPVLAETLSGQPRDAAVLRLVQLENVMPTTAAIARVAGRLRHQSGKRDSTIDAIVVATAAECRGSVIITSDTGDITAIASCVPEARLAIRDVNTPELPPRTKVRKKSARKRR
jgi:predicted nucleic acid-binding protein